MAFQNKIIDGGDILLYVGGKVVGCATSHSIEISNSTREVACKGTGDWTSSEYGRHSWTASVDALFNLEDSSGQARYKDLINLMINKQTVTVKSEYVDGGDTFAMQGEAIITGVSKNAGDADNASFSVSLQGRGALGIVGEDLFKVTLPSAAVTADYVVVTPIGMISPFTAGMSLYLPKGIGYKVQTVGTAQKTTASFSVTNADQTIAWTA